MPTRQQLGARPLLADFGRRCMSGLCLFGSGLIFLALFADAYLASLFPGAVFVALMLGCVLGLSGCGVFIAAFVRRAGEPISMCPKCGYDLAGIRANQCPECGRLMGR